MAFSAARGLLRNAGSRSVMARELFSTTKAVPQVSRVVEFAQASKFGQLSQTAKLWTSSQSLFQTGKRTLPFSASTVTANIRPTVHTAVKTAGQQIRTKTVSASPPKSFRSKFAAWGEANPIAFAMVVTLTRTAACDLFAQLGYEGKTWEEIDWRRFIGFMAFGGVYVAWLQYYIYLWIINPVNITAITGITGETGIAFAMALADQLIHSPFVYYPMYCLSMKIVEGSDNLLVDAWNKYANSVVDVCIASFTLWFPAQMINFYFLPTWMYIPYINAIGAMWVVWLSLQEGKSKAAPKEE